MSSSYAQKMNFQQTSSTYQMSNNSTYEPRVPLASSEKDLLISHLKSKLFQLEQNEKSYAELQSKFRGLQNEYQLMNEAKLRLEYELRQKTESTNKVLNELRGQNENLINELNEKNALNKKLFNDNTNIFRNLEGKKSENETLLHQINENENLIAHLSEDKAQADREISSLTNVSQDNQSKLGQLSQQMDKLNVTLDNKEQILAKKTNELANNQRVMNEEKFQNQNLIQKLGEIETALETSTKQLEMANKTIAEIENDYNQLNNDNEKTKSDFSNLKSNYEKERTVRTEAEKNNQKLASILNERNATLSKLALVNDSLKMNMDQVGNSRTKLLSDVDRYKSYIITLTEQTQKLTEELERIVEEDEKMYMQVDQVEKLGKFVNENKQILSQAMEALDDYRSTKSNPASRTRSPVVRSPINSQ